MLFLKALTALAFSLLVSPAFAQTEVSKPPDQGSYWSPLNAEAGTYVYASDFIAPITAPASELRSWLLLQNAPGPTVRFEIWGDTGGSGPSAATVLATTGSFYPNATSTLQLYSAEVQGTATALQAGTRYWFVVTVVGESGAGSYAVGGHTQNSVYADNGTFWYSNNPAGTSFDGQSLTPQMAFEVELTGLLTLALLDFGTQEVGTTSPVLTTTLENTDAADVDVTAIDSPAAPFARTGGTCATPPFTLVPGASCTLEYSFSPTAAGAASQSLAVTSTAPSSPDFLTLEGFGTVASLAATPDPLDFGSVAVGASSSQSISIASTGDADLTVTALDVAAPPFALVGGSCGPVPFTLTAGTDCTLDYTFSPTAAGAASQVLMVSSNDPGSPDSFTLQGTGVEPAIAISPDPLDFGQQPVGSTSAALAVTVANTGAADLDVSSVGTVAAPFAQVGGSCGPAPFSVPAGTSCTLEYTFAPTAAGAVAQSITVASNAPGAPHAFALRGTGTEPGLAITPAVVGFGEQPVGTTSGTLVATLANTGDAPLQIVAVDAAAAPFAQVGGSCGPVPIALAPGTACTLEYAFTPSATGASAQSISVASNAPGSPHGFQLQGSGTQATIQLNVEGLTGFWTNSAGDTVTRTGTIANGGDADLLITGLTGLDQPFAFAGGDCFPLPVTLAPGESCTVDVAFGPVAAPGSYSDAFDIVSNAAVSPVSVGVQGTMRLVLAVPALDRAGLLLLVLALVGLGGLVSQRRNA